MSGRTCDEAGIGCRFGPGLGPCRADGCQDVTAEPGLWLPAGMTRGAFAELGQRFSAALVQFRDACDGTTDAHLRVAVELLDVVHDQIVCYLRAAPDAEP